MLYRLLRNLSARYLVPAFLCCCCRAANKILTDWIIACSSGCSGTFPLLPVPLLLLPDCKKNSDWLINSMLFRLLRNVSAMYPVPLLLLPGSKNNFFINSMPFRLLAFFSEPDIYTWQLTVFWIQIAFNHSRSGPKPTTVKSIKSDQTGLQNDFLNAVPYVRVPVPRN